MPETMRSGQASGYRMSGSGSMPRRGTTAASIHGVTVTGRILVDPQAPLQQRAAAEAIGEETRLRNRHQRCRAVGDQIPKTDLHRLPSTGAQRDQRAMSMRTPTGRAHLV